MKKCNIENTVNIVCDSCGCLVVTELDELEGLCVGLVLESCFAQLANRVLVLFVMVCDELMAQSLNFRNHYIIQFSIFYKKINGNVYKIIIITFAHNY